MLKRLQLVVVMTLVYASVAMAQITTSGISGKVTSEGEDVIGATVTATHQPSGTVYYAVTNVDGRYTIQGMRPGGPYKVEITYVGHEAKTFDNVSLSFGPECHQDGCGHEPYVSANTRHAKYRPWHRGRRETQSAVDHHQQRRDVVCRYQ